MNLNDMAQAFAVSLAALGRKEYTMEETMRKLKSFLAYLSSLGIEHIDGITREIVRAYQVDVYQTLNTRGRPNSVAYQNSLIGVVKQFTAFLRDAELIVADPAKDIRYAKRPKRLPRSILSPSEARKIMQTPDLKSAIGYRDRTLLEILYSSGIRKAELRGLTLADADYQEGFLRVTGKGDKDRVVPIGRIACRYLENYIKSVRPELIRDPHEQRVFLSSRGKGMGRSTVWGLVKKYARKAKIKKNVHCHTFRHTCATAMLRNKADIRAIQELLGHDSLNSTQVYTRVSINDLKEVHKRCHPREKDKE